MFIEQTAEKRILKKGWHRCALCIYIYYYIFYILYDIDYMIYVYVYIYIYIYMLKSKRKMSRTSFFSGTRVLATAQGFFGPARPLMFGSLGAKPKECRIAGTGNNN